MVFQERKHLAAIAPRHEDAVPCRYLVIRRRVAKLHNLFPTNGQDNARAIRRGRLAQDDIVTRGIVGQPARLNRAPIQDRLLAA